jgi:hypothetical protein
MAERQAIPPELALLTTARALEVDRVTRAIVDRLEQSGVESILLKGPALAGWLYDDGAARAYMDCDLLVPPERFATAAAVLADEGFVAAEPEAEHVPKMGMAHAVQYHRPADGASVDLHRAPSGAAVAPSVVWDVMRRHTEPLSVGGRRVLVPTIPVRALIVTFHAAQHGADVPKPIEDLRRALERAADDSWREAAAIAEELDAMAAFTLGLGLLPEGRALAGRLGLVDERLARAANTADSSARLALGLDRLARTPGVRAKVALVRHEVVPTRDFMRWWSPLARRGPLGLAAAYAWRPLWLIRQLVPSLLLRRGARPPHGERLRAAELATLGGPFPLSTKVRLATEVAVTFPRARLAAHRHDDVRDTLRRLRGPEPPAGPDPDDPDSERLVFLGRRLGQSVARTMRYLPGDTRCLTQSLVLVRMLARRGIGSSLVLGVSPEGGFSAHAWVELSGRPLLPPREDVFRRLVEL